MIGSQNAMAEAQCVAPSAVTADKLGDTTTAQLAVTDANASNSDAAPRDGIVIVTIPPSAIGESGTSARLVIGEGATAIATDPIFPPGIYPMPIRAGMRVSIFGDGVSFAATVVMAI